MPGIVAEKKRFTQSIMCLSNSVQEDKLTLSKSSPCLTSQFSDDSYNPILPGLPDDVAKYCLALVPRPNFPAMGGVSKKWRSFIQSKEFITVRKLAGMLEEWLYVLTIDAEGKGSHWEVLDCLGRRHQLLPPMPGPTKAGFGVVVLNGKLLVMAGYSVVGGTGSASAEVYQYDSFLDRLVSGNASCFAIFRKILYLFQLVSMSRFSTFIRRFVVVDKFALSWLEDILEHFACRKLIS